MRPIKGYEGLYSITEDGKVWSHSKYRGEDGKFLRTWQKPNKYLSATLYKEGYRTFLVHRLVGIAYIKNPKTLPQINHINGIRDDNRVENLEWVNNSGNMQNAILRGTFQRKGSKHPLSKLTEKQVKRIRQIYRQGMKNQQEIATSFGITKSLVSQITLGKIWKHVA